MAITTHAVIRLLFILMLIILIFFAATRIGSQITGEVGEIVDVTAKAPDMSFFSADNINLKIDSTDDVFTAGSTIVVDTTSADHLVIAGGEISVKNVTIHDLYAVGGKVTLASGTIADDVVVAGGDITARPNFRIGSSAVIAGGSARIESAVPLDLRVGAGTVYLNSAVGGDARLSGDTVTLGPQARIAGDLLYRTDNLVIEPGAVISGRRMILPEQERSAFEDWGKGAGRLFSILGLAALLGFAILVMVIAAAVPSLMRSSAELMRTRPLRSLGLGVLIAAGVPLAAVLLFASVVGAPLAMLLLAICLAITPVAIAATAWLIGMEARRIATSQAGLPTGLTGRLLWPALGAAIILALGLVPLLGVFVWLFAMLFGLGAIVSRGGKALAQNA